MLKDLDQYILSMNHLSENIVKINNINQEIEDLLEYRNRLLSNQEMIRLRIRIFKN